jgi:hypothetical protein
MGTRTPRWAIAAWLATAAFAPAFGADLHLTAAQIVEKNAAARGGVEAWRKIVTMAWAGRVSAGGSPAQSVSFVLEQKRPNSTRFELMLQNQKSVRVFDGTNGWKLRPGEGGTPDLQAFSEDESRFAHDSHAIDGPLMDDVANGGRVTLGDIAAIDGRKVYTLNVTLPSGATHRIWVDAASFLEARFDRDIRKAGEPMVVSVSYGNYKAFDGLQLPTMIETGATKDKANKIVIEKVALNPPLDERVFAKPGALPTRHRGVAVDTRSAAKPLQP